MNLTFDIPEEFEDFARTYLIGRLAQNAGVELTVDANDALFVPGNLARVRAIADNALRESTGGTTIKPEVNVTDRDALHRHVGRHVAAGTAQTTHSEPVLTPEEQAALNDAAQAFVDDVEGDSGTSDEAPVAYEPVQVPDETASPETPEPVKPKAKRRTKAQIAADNAAAAGTPEAIPQAPLTDEQADAVAPAVVPHDDLEGPNGFPLEQHAAAGRAAVETATLPTVDPAMGEHLAFYTPERVAQFNANKHLFDPDRKAHLKEGREAIEKKGWAAYMATIQGLSLPQNITTFSDEQVQLHRAAISRLVNN